MKNNQKYTQLKARWDRNVVQWSPLESFGDVSLITTERMYLILESMELHRMFSKFLMPIGFQRVHWTLLESIRQRWIQLTPKAGAPLMGSCPKDDILKLTVRLDNAENFLCQG